MRSTIFVATSLLIVAWAAHAQPAPTDAQIAAIVVTANQVEIDAGKLAESKASSKEVREFAKRMISDHTRLNKQATELAQKLKIKPESNSTSETLKKSGEENLAKLKTLQGAEFDRAYVGHEVEYHQAVIEMLDKTLIPSAQNAGLKTLLVQARPQFVSHLEHAKQVQANVTG